MIGGGGLRVVHTEYQEFSPLIMAYLAEQHEAGAEVTEEALVLWYLELMEEETQTEAQLDKQLWLVRGVIEGLLYTGRLIHVHRPSEDPMRPELRVLLPSSATASAVRPPVRRQPG